MFDPSSSSPLRCAGMGCAPPVSSSSPSSYTDIIPCPFITPSRFNATSSSLEADAAAATAAEGPLHPQTLLPPPKGLTASPITCDLPLMHGGSSTPDKSPTAFSGVFTVASKAAPGGVPEAAFLGTPGRALLGALGGPPETPRAPTDAPRGALLASGPPEPPLAAFCESGSPSSSGVEGSPAPAVSEGPRAPAAPGAPGAPEAPRGPPECVLHPEVRGDCCNKRSREREGEGSEDGAAAGVAAGAADGGGGAARSSWFPFPRAKPIQDSRSLMHWRGPSGCAVSSKTLPPSFGAPPSDSLQGAPPPPPPPPPPPRAVPYEPPGPPARALGPPWDAATAAAFCMAGSGLGEGRGRGGVLLSMVGEEAAKDGRPLLERLEKLRNDATKEEYRTERMKVVDSLMKSAAEYPKVPGIYFDKHQLRWSAGWAHEGRRAAKYFPVKLFGMRRAYALAVQFKTSVSAVAAAAAAAAEGATSPLSADASQTPEAATAAEDEGPQQRHSSTIAADAAMPPVAASSSLFAPAGGPLGGPLPTLGGSPPGNREAPAGCPPWGPVASPYAEAPVGGQPMLENGGHFQARWPYTPMGAMEQPKLWTTGGPGAPLEAPGAPVGASRARGAPGDPAAISSGLGAPPVSARAASGCGDPLSLPCAPSECNKLNNPIPTKEAPFPFSLAAPTGEGGPLPSLAAKEQQVQQQKPNLQPQGAPLLNPAGAQKRPVPAPGLWQGLQPKGLGGMLSLPGGGVSLFPFASSGGPLRVFPPARGLMQPGGKPGAPLSSQGGPLGYSGLLSSRGLGVVEEPKDIRARLQQLQQLQQYYPTPGIHFDKHSLRWKSTWNDISGHRKAKYFPIVRYGFERARLLAIHARLTNHVPRTVRCQKAAAQEEAASSGVVVIQPQQAQPAAAATQPSKSGEVNQPASTTLQSQQQDQRAGASNKPQSGKDGSEAGSSHSAPSSASPRRNSATASAADSQSCADTPKLSGGPRSRFEANYDEERDKRLSKAPSRVLVRHASRLARVPGIWFDKKQLRWACTFTDTQSGRRRAEYFPIRHYGFMGARLRAVDARRKMQRSRHYSGLQQQQQGERRKAGSINSDQQIEGGATEESSLISIISADRQRLLLTPEKHTTGREMQDDLWNKYLVETIGKGKSAAEDIFCSLNNPNETFFAPSAESAETWASSESTSADAVTPTDERSATSEETESSGPLQVGEPEGKRAECENLLSLEREAIRFLLCDLRTHCLKSLSPGLSTSDSLFHKMMLQRHSLWVEQAEQCKGLEKYLIIFAGCIKKMKLPSHLCLAEQRRLLQSVAALSIPPPPVL